MSVMTKKRFSNRQLKAALALLLIAALLFGAMPYGYAAAEEDTENEMDVASYFTAMDPIYYWFMHILSGVSDFSPEEAQLFVNSLLRPSLRGCPAEKKQNILDRVYDLLYVAFYRPQAFGSTDADINSWPYQNSTSSGGAGTYGSSVWDDNLQMDFNTNLYSTTVSGSAQRGCPSYACACSNYIYDNFTQAVPLQITDQPGAAGEDGKNSEEKLRYLLDNYADPGEIIQNGTKHTIVFLARDKENAGFYFLHYGGGWFTDYEGAKHNYNQIKVSYTTYSDFVNKYEQFQYGTIKLLDTNEGSFYSGTASDFSGVTEKAVIGSWEYSCSSDSEESYHLYITSCNGDGEVEAYMTDSSDAIVAIYTGSVDFDTCEMTLTAEWIKQGLNNYYTIEGKISKDSLTEDGGETKGTKTSGELPNLPEQTEIPTDWTGEYDGADYDFFSMNIISRNIDLHISSYDEATGEIGGTAIISPSSRETSGANGAYVFTGHYSKQLGFITLQGTEWTQYPTGGGYWTFTVLSGIVNAAAGTIGGTSTEGGWSMRVSTPEEYDRAGEDLEAALDDYKEAEKKKEAILKYLSCQGDVPQSLFYDDTLSYSIARSGVKNKVKKDNNSGQASAGGEMAGSILAAGLLNGADLSSFEKDGISDTDLLHLLKYKVTFSGSTVETSPSAMSAEVFKDA